MAKKSTLTGKTTYLARPLIPSNQQLTAAEFVSDIVGAINENYDRLPLDWDDDIADNQVLPVHQRIRYSGIDYICITSYDVGSPKTFTIGNFELVNSGISGGIAEIYADIATMIADQANQEENEIFEVTDASADSTVDSGKAWYRLGASETADLSDYEKISEGEAFSETLTGKVDKDLSIVTVPGATYTPLQANNAKMHVFTSATGCVVTLPNALNDGYQFLFKQTIASQSITLNAEGTLVSDNGNVLTGQNKHGFAYKSASTEWSAIIPGTLNDEFTESSGTVISFDVPRKYGYPTAETGNITFNFTNAKDGMVQEIRHNHTVKPTLGAEAVPLTNGYTISVDNIIMAMAIKVSTGPDVWEVRITDSREVTW